VAVAFLSEVEDFAAFYERSYQLAYRTAYGIVGDAALAADVTQDAFVAAYRARERFRGEAPARAWLVRIVVNTALSAHRRAPVKPMSLDEEVATVAAPQTEQNDRLELERALDSLPVRQRAAVVLRYYHGFDYAEIARLLDTSPGNVGSMLSRAMVGLRQQLDSSGFAAATGSATTPGQTAGEARRAR
jgi:RNA polymerase sigma-70 factor (ECF subfamily)